LKTRGSLTSFLWKDGQEIYMLTAEGNICDDSNPPGGNLTFWNSITGFRVMLTVLILWLTAVWWFIVISSGSWNCLSTFWI